MDDNKALVGELRSYLSSAQHCVPSSLESDQVRQLKRDLNLAARVGQQLLMQLQQADKSREKHELEIARLKATNAQLSQENKRLVVEQDLISENLGQQEAEISNLLDQLKLAKSRADQLSRAQATARALEREVNMLETAQRTLRAELETSQKLKKEAENLARKLAANMVGQLTDQLQELKNEVLPEVANPPNNSDTSIFETANSSLDPKSSVEYGSSNEMLSLNKADQSSEISDTSKAVLLNLDSDEIPSLTIDNDTMPGDISEFEQWAAPNDTGTPLRPQLVRSHSHESVFSPAKILSIPYNTGSRNIKSPQSNLPAFIKLQPATLQPPKLQPTTLRPLTLETVSALSTLVPVSGESYVESDGVWKNLTARDKLSSMRIVQAKDRRKWGFSAFR